MNILMIAPQYRPLVGGYERAAERLSMALVGHGDKVTVITERRLNNWKKKEVIDGINIIRWGCVYRPHLHILSSGFGLFIQLIRCGLKYDIWHVHQYGIHAAIAIVMGKIYDRPVVLKLTNSAGMGLKKTLSNVRLSIFAVKLHKKVSAVIPLTKEMAVEAREFGIPDYRIKVIGNGIDTEIFKPRQNLDCKYYKTKVGIKTKNVIIFVGRLSKEKNVVGLLNAWCYVSDKVKETWSLFIVGDGPQRDELKELTNRLKIDNTVIFAGFRDDISECLSIADIYVSSSDNEGLSNSLLEAMSSGLPIISTRVSGVKEIVENTGSGIVVDIGDMVSLSKAIEQMASSAELRNRASEKARNYIIHNYSIEVVMKKHIDLYRSLKKNRYRFE